MKIYASVVHSELELIEAQEPKVSLIKMWILVRQLLRGIRGRPTIPKNDP
jgi:hypothetical protein